MAKRDARAIWVDATWLVGLAAIAAGVAMIHVPAAFITVGAVLLIVATAGATR